MKTVFTTLFWLGAINNYCSAYEMPTMYQDEIESRVVSPNQLGKLADYKPTSVQVIFQDTEAPQPVFSQNTGLVNTGNKETTQELLSHILHYSIKLTEDILPKKLTYHSSRALITADNARYVEYPFYTENSYVWAKGVALTYPTKTASVSNTSILTVNLDQNLRMMIAMGEKLPIINDKFIGQCSEQLSQKQATNQEIYLPVFRLTTQKLQKFDFYSSFFSTNDTIPSDTSYVREEPTRSELVIDSPFSFGLYNPQTRQVYLQGILSSSALLNTMTPSYWDSVPSVPVVSSLLRYVGL